MTHASPTARSWTAAPVRDVHIWNPEVTWTRTEAGVLYVRPVQELGAYPDNLLERLEHWASVAPERVFLAQRGSWNRTQKSGFRVMMVTLRPGDVPKYEVFAEGWLQGDQIWGRPVYTRQMKDGSLLIADDYAGAIYRVTYQP